MGESAPKPAGVSPAVLVLSLLLAVATTAAVLFAVRPVAPPHGGTGGGTTPAAPQADPAPAEPLTQKDTVAPRDHPTGQVFYPIPYAQPANVELHNNSYTTFTESRTNGFKWKNVCEKGKEFFAYGDVEWVAKGVRPTDGK